MRSKSKLIVAILTASAVLLSTTSALAAKTPVDGVTGLNLLEGYEDVEKEADLVAAQKIWEFSATDGTATADDAFKGNGALAVKMAAPTEQAYCYTKVPLGDSSLTGEAGFLFYVKMPVNSATAAEGNNDNEFKLGLESNVASSAGGYLLADQATVQSLPAGEDAWQSVTSYGGSIWLPNGYEGYLKFNLSDFAKNWGDVDDDVNQSVDKLNHFSIYIASVGGKLADDTDNAFYLDDIMTFDSTYDGSIDFRPSPPDEPTASFEPTKLIDNLYSFENFDQYTKGESLIWPGPVWDPGDSQNGVAVADDTYKGIGGYSAKIDNDLIAVGWVALKLGLPYGADFTPYDGFMIYMKGPKDCTREDKWGTFGLSLNFDCNKSDSEGGYMVKSKEKVGVLCAGTTTWTETECIDGNIYLPYDFEGYLKVSYSSLTYNWGADLSQDFSEAVKDLNFFTVWISGLGQEYGSVYFDDFLFYSKDYNNETTFLPEDWESRTAPLLETPSEDEGGDDDDELEDVIIPGLNDNKDDDNNGGTGNGNNSGSTGNGTQDNTQKPVATGVEENAIALVLAVVAIGTICVFARKKRHIK